MIFIEKFTPEIIKKIEDEQIDKIVFSYYFNDVIPEFPDSVKIIIFGGHDMAIGSRPKINCDADLFKYNKPFDNLPKNLTHLIFATKGKFNHPLDNLPVNLEYLAIALENYYYDFNNLPPTLKYLDIMLRYDNTTLEPGVQFKSCNKKMFNCLPKNLKNFKLSIEYYYFNSDDSDEEFEYERDLIDNLPTTIEELTIDADVMLEYLPNSIKKLIIHYKPNQSLDLIPNLIEKLEIYEKLIINNNNLNEN